jgi:hypothetical protein
LVDDSVWIANGTVDAGVEHDLATGRHFHFAVAAGLGIVAIVVFGVLGAALSFVVDERRVLVQIRPDTTDRTELERISAE